MKKWSMLVVLLLVALMSSGCYWQRQVEANEVGIKMDDGVKITAVVGPGRYTNMGFYADMKVVSINALTQTWSDPDLVTRDKQPIGFELSVTFARKSDSESVTKMWTLFNTEAKDDESLRQQVLARIPRVAKAITTKYTLDEMLGVSGDAGREIVQQDMFDLLEGELKEVNVDLLDVGINNISPDETYLTLLREKANAQVAVEVSKEKTKQLKEQVLQEEAQTNVDIERARRSRLVAEEEAKIYEVNEEWYRLEYINRLGQVIGDNDKLWFFVEPGTDMTLLLDSSSSNVVPLER